MSTQALDLERDLNAQQISAVTHGEGPQLVLAGAGSGKTRVITYRIAWLVKEQGVDPASIVAVTFTNKAAGEMKERVESLLGLYPLPTFVGTFHRFALGLLRRFGGRIGMQPDFVIFDRDDQLKAVKRAVEDEGLAESAFPPRTLLGTISSAKNRLLNPQAFEQEAEGFYQERAARVYNRYQGILKQASAVDFDDMLRYAVRLLSEEGDIRERQRSRIRHLLVDEFQDTNHAQMQMIHEIVGEEGNLTAVGDEDQGIYRWRGADLDNVLNFEASFPGAKVRKLEQNYRSTQAILQAAGELVEHNERRRGKKLWSDGDQGQRVELYRARDEIDEARWVVATLQDMTGQFGRSEMAVLVRTNAQTRAFEEELLRQRMPYELVGGVRFYERAEIKDLIAYLRLLKNPQDSLSLARVLNQPPRGIGKTTAERLQAEARSFGGSLWQALNHLEPGSFPARSAKSLSAFRDLLQGLMTDAQSLSLPALLERVLEVTDYTALYRDKGEEAQARLENIKELLSAAQEFTERAPQGTDTSDLTAFLDHASLVSDIDNWQADRGVSLMTLHSAKGLEFEAVVVGGLEEGLLPHFNAGESQDDLEEERRLLYVGMTRARQRLFLTTCKRRRIAGRYQDQNESPFILEIPADSLDVSESSVLFHDARSRSVLSFFDRPAATTASQKGGEQGGFARGAKVRHPTLGEGVILATEGKAEAKKITVFFQASGKRKLLAKYANLEYL